jgi:glucosylceramidase
LEGLTDASAETFYKLPVEKQEEILNAYFDPERGIGYNLCRTNINSCDFSSDSYAYAETDGDVSLEHFSIEHDRKYKIPLIKAAVERSGNDVRLFATMITAWMKPTTICYGVAIKPEYYQSWADCILNSFRNIRKLPIWTQFRTTYGNTDRIMHLLLRMNGFVKILGPHLKNQGF